MPVASWTSSTDSPPRSACWTSTIRPSVGRRASSRSGAGLLGRRARALPVEAAALLLERAQRLLQRLGEGAADRHRLADRLHRRRERVVGGGELLEREPRHLDDDVVERRLEGCRGLAGDVVGHLVEGVADRHLRGDLRDREPGRLGGQGRRARDAGVHLDDDDPAVDGVDRELDVAAAGVDADLADHRDADVAQPLVLAVGEGERRGDGDRVAGVHAHRVEVLDGADDDDVVGVVAHHLELVLLPAHDRLLEEHLGDRAVLEAGAGDAHELVLVVREPAAEAAHREGRAHDDGVAEVVGRGEHLAHRVADERAGRLGAAALDDALELLAVLAELDRLDVGADERAVVLLEDAAVVQVHRAVERRLAAEGGEHGIRPLLGDDLLDDLRGDRLDVGRVGELGVGHDRRGVGVDEDDPDALLAQHAARLGAGVVELAGLADDDRAGADDEHALDVVALGHQAPTSWWVVAGSAASDMRSTKRSKR